MLRTNQIERVGRRRGLYRLKPRQSRETRISSGQGALPAIGMSQIYTYSTVRGGHYFKTLHNEDSEFFCGALRFLPVVDFKARLTARKSF